ncbi:MarP family serine protease [Fodinicola feengrottensis]|uniref:MarP family serine protease n=1 Tax=Fodinicola feengrottensis TaxID=435914 RepID=A0ABN2GP95_9ACTN
MSGSMVDVVLLAVMVLFGLNGYRQGFVVGLLSFVGFIGGALLGLQLAPLLAELVTDVVWRLVVALAAVFVVASAGQALAVIIGSAVRERLNGQRIRVMDSIGGGALSVVAVLLVGWMVAVPLARAPLPGLASQVNRSAIIPVVSRIMPPPVRKVYSSFADSIDSGDVPGFFSPLAAIRLRAVAAPDPALASAPVVSAVRPSVLKIDGQAPSCQLEFMGSGFVISPEHVLTNAHVVAGVTDDLHVIAADGGRVDAQVVYIDPEHDLAVLYAPGLTAPPLVFAGLATDNADAIVLGYPGNHSYTATPARIRDHQTVSEPDIYHRKSVMRDIYPLRTNVHPGNSGGPLLTPAGKVYGVVFAASPRDRDTGFALSAMEAAPAVAAARDLTTPVGTGECAGR